MARRQADGLRGQQIDKRIRGGWHGFVHGVQHLFILMRPRDGEDTGVVFADIVGFCAKASRHDNLAVFAECLTNCIQTFGLGTV